MISKNINRHLDIGGLKVEVPIVQGGMGVCVSLSGLASAVAQEGGVGVISATGIGMREDDFLSDFMKANRRALKEELRRAKSKTSGVIGVNLMVALSDYAELFKTAFDEGADVVFVGAGLPRRIPKTIDVETVKNSPTKFVPIVSSGRAARVIFRSWSRNYDYVPDGVVVEGPKAGGHLGFKKDQINSEDYTLDKILPDVIEVIKKYRKDVEKNIPVIAAGGIYTGADIDKYMELGAEAVQLGTKFVATQECDASDIFKKSYVECDKEDIQIIDSPVGLPGRAINNEFLQEIAAGHGQKFTCPGKCLKSCKFNEAPYCICLALTEACVGNLDEGFAFAGENAYRVEEISTVKEVFRELIEGSAKLSGS
ncbi:MAG: NAD(P)H-dependent flavin oxidoreductase [Elusimicrobiota bacterium]